MHHVHHVDSWTQTKVTLGVEEGEQLSAQLGVGHGLLDKSLLLCQLLRTEILRLPGHPLVVVQHGQEGDVRGPGEENVLVHIAEQAGSRRR